MTRKKHIISRIHDGLYSYRAYAIWRGALDGWFVKNEDGGVFVKRRTLAAMRRTIDRWEAKAARATND